MPLLTDLEQFVHEHRPHGGMTADATEPAWNRPRRETPQQHEQPIGAAVLLLRLAPLARRDFRESYGEISVSSESRGCQRAGRVSSGDVSQPGW